MAAAQGRLQLHLLRSAQRNLQRGGIRGDKGRSLVTEAAATRLSRWGRQLGTRHTVLLPRVCHAARSEGRCTQNHATCTRLTFEVAGRRLLRQHRVDRSMAAEIKARSAGWGISPS